MEKPVIYVATHKIFTPPKDPIYKPITAGASMHDLPYLPDDLGENISNKNPYYSELTALYWIKKHNFCRIVGFNHYHRYFYKKHFLNEEEIRKILNQYDMIVPKAMELSHTLFDQYNQAHYGKDLKLACCEILKRNSAYRPYVEEVLNQNRLYYGNMFVTSKEILDEYLEFLFSILFSLEKQIPYLTYPDYQKRVFGFLAERIFTIYLAYKQFYVKEYPVIDTKNENLVLRKIKDTVDFRRY